MDYRDYYQILGVSRGASDKEIRQAYRRLARRYHPDRNPGDKAAEERFKEINEAHEVLTDPDKRRKYDQLGAQWQQWQRMGGNPGTFDFSQWFASRPRRGNVEYGNPDGWSQGTGDFSDFFESVFGAAGAQPTMRWRQEQRRGRRGQDYHQSVQITLEQAYHGTTCVVTLNNNRLEVKIPPGVRTGSVVRVAGKGGPGIASGQAGDLFLDVQVLSDPHFERKDDDLYCDVQVGLYTALLGGQVRIRTIKGSVQLRIPPETQSGCSFRLKGLGMPFLHDPHRHGDLFARVQVVLPQNLTERERELLRDLAALRE
jgi:curved DNA-binding protein